MNDGFGQSSVEKRFGLATEFCFDDALGLALDKMLAEDIESADFTLLFRIFYRIRHLLPIRVRQLLQRARNRSIIPSAGWYMSSRLSAVFESLEHSCESFWPNQAAYSLVLTHDIETRACLLRIPKLAKVEEELGFRSCWNIVPYKYKIDMGIVRDLRQRGHEIGIHGYNHDGRLFLSKQIFDSRVPKINRAIEEFEAIGFRAPMVHRNLQWMQQLNIQYDASCFDVDPFQAMPGGIGGIWPFSVGKFVELPYTLPQDHTLFVSLGETCDRIWRKKLEYIQRYHGMALMLTHPDYLDRPSTLAVYENFLRWLRDHSQPWHVLPREMASWFRNRKAQPSP